jgi:hypothetical protein
MVEWAKTYVSLSSEIRATNRQIVYFQILCLLFTLGYPLPGYSPYTLAWSFLDNNGLSNITLKPLETQVSDQLDDNVKKYSCN